LLVIGTSQLLRPALVGLSALAPVR